MKWIFDELFGETPQKMFQMLGVFGIINIGWIAGVVIVLALWMWRK